MGDKTLAAPGVSRLECGWGYYLRGSKPALLASGLAKPDWFADGTERDKGGRCIRSKRIEDDGRDIRTNAPKVGACTVLIHYTDAEKEVMNREEAAAEQRKLMQPEALRAHVEDKHFMIGVCSVMLAFNIGSNPDNKWSFPQNVRGRALELCVELKQLFWESKIIPGVPVRGEQDAEFQRFMQSALISQTLAERQTKH